MLKIKIRVILGIIIILQTTLTWALNARLVAYAPHAQLANNQVPAYSFKMDAKENVPYLATILRDGDAANHIELQRLVSTENGNYSLQEVAPRIQINPNSHKLRLILVPNANDSSTTPCIAYVDGDDNTLKLYQGYGTAPNINWKEVPIHDNDEDITDVQDLDVAVTQDGSLDIAVMNSLGKVDLLSTQNVVHYIIKNDPFRINNRNSALGEGKSMRLVLSSMSGLETPYLVYSKYQSYNNWPMALVKANNSHWETMQGPYGSDGTNIDDRFDAAPCNDEICVFYLRNRDLQNHSDFQLLEESNSGYNLITLDERHGQYGAPDVTAAPSVAFDGDSNYVLHTATDMGRCSVNISTAHHAGLFTDMGEISNICTNYSALVMYPSKNHLNNDAGFALISNPDGWYVIKAISF